MSLLQSFKDFCCSQGLTKTYWIGLSGGLDSQVLLLLCQALSTSHKVSFRAIHINHGLSPHAEAWAEICKTLCVTYGIDFIEHKLNLAVNPGDSLEALARDARYQAFKEYIEEGDILLTAHHQDDQAETLILQLLRGAGLKGLSAMPAIKPLGRGFHARPLLTVNRETLYAFACEHELKWIEDEMNADSKLSRNFIRKHIMPVLKTRWPTVSATISRSARHCAEAQILLDEFANGILASVRGEAADTLSVSKLSMLSNAQQQLILRAWIYQQGCRLPPTKKLVAIQKNVLEAAWDCMPCVSWDQVEVRRHKDNLYVINTSSRPALQSSHMNWTLVEPLVLPDGRFLKARLVRGKGLRADVKNVTIKFRQGGEMVSLGKRGRHTLKNLFQEWNIVPWERDSIPLVYIDEELIGVIGHFLSYEWMASDHEWGWEWQL